MTPNHENLAKQNILNWLTKGSYDNLEIVRATMLDKFFKLTDDQPKYLYIYKDIKLTSASNVNKELFTAPKEVLDELNKSIDIYIVEKDNYDQLKWYLKTVLNEANGLATVKACIPQYLHNHITIAFYWGEKTVEDLKVDKYYEMLEEAPLKNVILRG